jgi:hypothetical protein
VRPSYKSRYIDHAPELKETQARSRRLDLFKSITGLKERRTKPSYLALVPRTYIDHISYWSYGSSEYVLCEPYNHILPIDCPAGLEVIVVPVEIAPYGGGWSDDPAAQPGTIGLLFGLSFDQGWLSQLERKLQDEAVWLPRWNQVAES